MPENILKLKKKAVDKGMAKADAMKADRATLESFLADGGKKDKTTATKKKAVAKKKGGTTKKAARTTTKKADKPERKKATAKKQERKAPKRGENTDGLGRLNIASLDWTAESDEWNPKKGGPVEKLFKALKKTKGNIDKAFSLVEGDMYEFVGKRKRDGSKRTKAEAQAMLRYRLNRTKFEFAVRTGQHESADSKNRAEYGHGTYATTRKAKPARKTTTKSKKASTAKSGKKSARKK